MWCDSLGAGVVVCRELVGKFQVGGDKVEGRRLPEAFWNMN